MDAQKKWFEATVKTLIVDINGKSKKVSEKYLVDAMTYTEAEAIITKEMELVHCGSFTLCPLKLSTIETIKPSDIIDDDLFFKVKINILDVDLISGKEKKFAENCLFQAKDFETAVKYAVEYLNGYVIPTQIESITETNFLEIFNN